MLYSLVRQHHREGVTAVKDKIYIGGDYKVVILNTDGSRVREITTDGGYNDNLLYNERNDQLLLRLLSFVCLVVLINCIENSCGRVTTALYVHGTTVMQ
jgi:hypothetical protein